MDGPLGRLALLLTAILTIWIYHAIDQSSVLEHPLSSQFLVPLLSSGVAFVTIFAIKRLSSGPGRFDDDGQARSLEESRAVTVPKRPVRGSWALLPFLIAFRLYLLSSLQHRLQCSPVSGLEGFLPILLAAYDGYRYNVAGRTVSAVPEDDDYDDISLDTFEVLANWFSQSPFPTILGVSALTWGFMLVNISRCSSTIICPASESPTLVLFWQLSGLVLDAIILTLAWRIMQWGRSTTDRVRSLGIILFSSAFFSAFFVLVQYKTSSEFSVAAAKSFNSLDFIHVSGQSAVLLFIAATLCTTQASPLAATSILVFLCGVYSAWNKLVLVGTYEQLYKSEVIYGTAALGLGFIVLAYRTRIRHIGLSRFLFCFCITAWVIGATVYCALVNTADHHPIGKIIYSTRTEVDRWLVHDAKVSESLSVAVREYQDRHNGRKPPPNFDKWYKFATARDSPIIDQFRQIDEDLEPFWRMSPEEIKEGFSKLAHMEGIIFIIVNDGYVSALKSADNPLVADLVQLIQRFAQHLPNLQIPVNLLDSPRVLPSWTHVTLGHNDAPPDETSMWSWEHQHQLGQACPPKTPSSAGFFLPTAQFCGSCARPHSIGQFPTPADLSIDLCHQPDMLNLHGFYINNHPIRPFKELLPVFSRAKTNQYKDILIPLSRGESDYEAAAADEEPLADKENRLFYRGAVAASSPPPPKLLWGGHQERLSHILSKVWTSDYVTVLLPKDGNEELFQYKATSLKELNHMLWFDVGISDYSACTVPECEQFKAEFGEIDADPNRTAKIESQYVMVMDGDFGPPQDLLSILRSNSVPVVASVFKEWYTERLFPWLHYVPIDFRFHGLHSTLAYFMGLKRSDVVNGLDKVYGRDNIDEMKAHTEDAKWIAQEGKRWAARAVRREDAEVYAFRLLLEWGRVMSEEGRESLGFSLYPH